MAREARLALRDGSQDTEKKRSRCDRLFENMRNRNKIKAVVTPKKDIMAGVKDLDSGRFRIYNDANLTTLADEIGRSGRNQLIAAKGTVLTF